MAYNSFCHFESFSHFKWSAKIDYEILSFEKICKKELRKYVVILDFCEVDLKD